MMAAVEDELSEAVVRKVVSTVTPQLGISHFLRRAGIGYLRAKIRSFNQAASNGVPILWVADLDSRVQCPADKLSQWLRAERSELLLARFAVMEIESWVLADREACARWLGIDISRIPLQTDVLDQPKEFLVSLARRCRHRRLREDLVPLTGATTPVGRNYNARVGEFVQGNWDVGRACRHSESLGRAVRRLREFAEYYGRRAHR